MMRAPSAVALASLVLASCGTNTKGSWTCSAPAGGATCASIEAIDNSGASRTSAASPGVASAAPVRWWAPQPFVFSETTGPRREGDQVMRVIFAPWVDSQGDFHARSEVHAVMRRGGWWVATPSVSAPSAAPVETAPGAE